jgi:hypothetical protein
MEEAICFGWIDTTVKRIDEDIYQRSFVKRNKNSRWSTATLGYAADLIKRKKRIKEVSKRAKENKKQYYSSLGRESASFGSEPFATSASSSYPSSSESASFGSVL